MLILVYITFHFTIVTGFLGILPDIVPLRTTKYGPVIGFIKDLNETAFIHAYLGIPYAKPPIGNLRFKAPQPPNTWTEPLWCRKWKPKCYRSFSAFEVPQSEDCLYLNVFTGPKCVDVEQCPVLVYLHGGRSPGFLDIEAIKKIWVTRGAVVVTVDFRSEVLGFWQYGSSDHNNGLQDVILSLEWVRENIAEFGGDNNSITIMGDGSGAQMASLLTLIPRGIDSLFSRSIQLDGTAFVPATLQSLKPAYAQLAQDFGCLNDDSTDLSVMSCMNTVEATKLQEAYGREYVKIKPKTCWINDPPIHIELQNEVFNISTLNRTKTSLVLGTTASETRGNCSSAVKCLNSFDHPQQINEACEKDYDIHKNDNPIRDSLMNNPIFTEASAVRTSGSKVFLFDTTAITSEQLIGYMFGGFKLHLDPSKIRVADTLSQLLINFIQYDNPTPFGAENETVWQPLKKPIGFNFLAVDFNGIFNEPFYHYQSVMFWQAVAPIVDFVITKTEADELALHKQRLTALWVTIGVLIGALVFSTVPICILKCVTDRRKRLEDQDFLVDSSDRISLLCHRSCYANYGTSDVSEPLNIERLHK